MVGRGGVGRRGVRLLGSVRRRMSGIRSVCRAGVKGREARGGRHGFRGSG